MRENMQNSRTNRAAIFVYSYFLTARHASHYRSHATITSPLKATPPALAQKVLFLKISLPLHLSNPPQVKDQGRTKDEPRNTQRTPNPQKVLFIKIAVSFTSLIPCLIPPRELRETT